MRPEYDNETNREGIDDVAIFFYMCLLVVALLVIGVVLYIAKY